MTDVSRAETVRLECLRLALAVHGAPGSIVADTQVLDTARALESYIRGTDRATTKGGESDPHE